MTDGSITCGGCSARWSGVNRAHCSGCHLTFATTNLFDAHRTPDGDHGTCLDPVEQSSKSGAPKFLLRDGVWHGRAAPPRLLARWAELRDGAA